MKISAIVSVAGAPPGYYSVRVFTTKHTWYGLWKADYAKPSEAQVIDAWREDTYSGRHASKNWERA